jgi:hypothetical protein
MTRDRGRDEGASLGSPVWVSRRRLRRWGSASATARRGAPPAPERRGAQEACRPEAVCDGDVLAGLVVISAVGACGPPLTGSVRCQRNHWNVVGIIASCEMFLAV